MMSPERSRTQHADADADAEAQSSLQSIDMDTAEILCSDTPKSCESPTASPVAAAAAGDDTAERHSGNKIVNPL